MKTSSFEVQFITRLRDHINGNYPELRFSVPRSERQPDIVIENSRTRQTLWIQVAGGSSSSPIPAATISVLIEMNAAMRTEYAHTRRAEIWLVSSAQVLPPWSDILAKEHIRVITAGSVDDALIKMDQSLRSLH